MHFKTNDKSYRPTEDERDEDYIQDCYPYKEDEALGDLDDFIVYGEDYAPFHSER